jgi:hypothetical protein
VTANNLNGAILKIKKNSEEIIKINLGDLLRTLTLFKGRGQGEGILM